MGNVKKGSNCNVLGVCKHTVINDKIQANWKTLSAFGLSKIAEMIISGKIKANRTIEI